VSTGAELDVTDAQAGQLRDPETGLHCDVEQDVVSPSGPGATVGRAKQGIDLGLLEVADLLSLAALGRDLEHAGDE